MTSENYLLQVASDLNEHKKRSRIGIYDQNILCEDCEKEFSLLDDYGAKVLLVQRHLVEIKDPDSQEILAYRVEGAEIDFDKLRRFFLSIAYRAHLSSVKFFQKINLGPYEKIFFNIIFKGVTDNSLCIFLQYVSSDELEKIAKNSLLDPHLTRIDGINFLKFYLGSGFVLYVKVDKRPAPDPFNLLSLGVQSRIFMIAGDFTKEIDLLKKIILTRKK